MGAPIGNRNAAGGHKSYGKRHSYSGPVKELRHGRWVKPLKMTKKRRSEIFKQLSGNR